MTLATLPDAIDWARARWDNQRAPTLRLHTRDTEGLGPFYAPGFAALLSQSVRTWGDMQTSRPCGHWARRSGELCPDCAIYDKDGLPIAESGIYLKRERLYRFPMTVALEDLRRARNDMPRHPHPYRLVLILAEHGWNARAAAVAIDRPWEVAEALFLTALRKLHGRYHEGPRNDGQSRTAASGHAVAWTELSESQRNAIDAA